MRHIRHSIGYMAGDLEDIEMAETSRYPEYDDMDEAELEDELAGLYDKIDINKPSRRFKYVEDLLEIRREWEVRSIGETSFIDDGKTVTIKKRGEKVVVPAVEFVDPDNYGDVSMDNFEIAMAKQEDITTRIQNLLDADKRDVARVQRINKMLTDTYGKRLGMDPASRELVNRTAINKAGSILFKYKKQDGTLARPVIIMKVVGDKLQFSKNRNPEYVKARKQVRELARAIANPAQEPDADQEPDIPMQLPGPPVLPGDGGTEGPSTSRVTARSVAPRLPTEEIELDEFPFVETNVERPSIAGLTSEENRELCGVLDPLKTIDPESRIGPNGALQVQADHFQEAIDATRAELDRALVEDPYDDRLDRLEGRLMGLEEAREQTSRQRRMEKYRDRILGLEEARDQTLEQRELEEVREQQEQDITRYQRFKEFAKENMLGLSAISISIAGIITTIIVGARKAIVQGAQATSKFAKALYNLGKKLGPLLAPLLTIISYAISAGAKGLAWLASNLWVLAIAMAWFVYDQYKRKGRR